MTNLLPLAKFVRCGVDFGARLPAAAFESGGTLPHSESVLR
jgi:hypothetical protein